MEKTLASFETVVEELEQTLQKMSDNDTTLDESIRLYASAAELIAQGHEILKQSEVRIEEIDKKLECIKDSL